MKPQDIIIVMVDGKVYAMKERDVKLLDEVDRGRIADFVHDHGKPMNEVDITYKGGVKL